MIWRLHVHNFKWCLASNTMLGTAVSKFCMSQCNIPLYRLASINIRLPKVLFRDFVWPSVCEWATLLNFKEELNIVHKVSQKWLRHVMDFGTSCNLIIFLKSSLAALIASIDFLQCIKCVIFEYLSTTTKIKSIPHWVRRRPNKKSMEISFQICSGIGV